MKKLYAPWRTGYTNSTARMKEENISPEECVFCIQFKENNDEKYYILKRFKHHAAVLNRYPYNAGHMMVLPLEHVASIQDLSEEARHEMIDLANICTHMATTILGAQGVNIGTNIGRAAGAGIPSHLHMHVLPRWVGDTNFLPTLGDVKAVSFDLDEAYKKLKPEFDKLK